MSKTSRSTVDSVGVTITYNAKVQSTVDVTNVTERGERVDQKAVRKPLVGNLSESQNKMLDSLTRIHLKHDCGLSMTPLMGAEIEGLPFHSLELLGLDCALTSIRIEIADGAVAAFWLFYDDGSIFSRGKSRGGETFELADFIADEKIISTKIGTGKETVGSQRSEEA